MVANSIFDLLCSLNVCNKSHIIKIQNFVRDREDISVYQCSKSGVIFLSQTKHMRVSHYVDKNSAHAHDGVQRQRVNTDDDSERRYTELKNRIRGKRWLDFGTGPGGILDRLGPLAKKYAAVELQQDWVKRLSDLGHAVYSDLTEIENCTFDIITLFHVFEHLSDPLDVLSFLKSLLSKNGRIIIEVPHARDALITFFDCPEFKAHTFWSEHLILHTRQSLTALCEACGFDVVSIKGVQRYPLANHLYWLSEGKPGGHEVWSFLRDDALDRSWRNTLAAQDATDTLFAELRVSAPEEQQINYL